MVRFREILPVLLCVVFLFNTGSAWGRKGSSTGRKSPSSSSKPGTQSKTSNTQQGNYPRQPQQPSRNANPYPAGGSYPHPGNTNPGGYPRQNHPAGSNPNQNPGRANPGGYPNQNPAFPPAGGHQPAGGYPNQNPAFPPAGRGNYPNQNPGAGGYPAGGQYPAAGGYPNNYPGRSGYPNQYPAAGGYPQYPGAGGFPAGGGYPVRTGNTGQGWGGPGGNPGGYPGGYPGGAVGGYQNWNPNNKILSPRFGGGGYGYGGQGMGGSPFSRSVSSMGIQPKSSGFAKKAMLAAGVGAVAGMAVGYGLGQYPRPHFTFRNPEEEYYYNNYMYRRYGTQSTDEKDYGRDYVYKPPPRAESYEKYMGKCMNRTDLLKDQGTPKSEDDEDDRDTVSIEEIGYPALIEQMKAKKCVEEYMAYSERFLVEKKAAQQYQPSRSSPLGYGVMQLFPSFLVLLSSMLLLQ